MEFRHDVLISVGGILDREVWLSRGFRGRSVFGSFGRVSFSLDDPKPVFARLDGNEPARCRRWPGYDQYPLGVGGVCFGSERQACRREHGDQYRPKIGRTARDNGRGFCYLAFGK